MTLLQWFYALIPAACCISSSRCILHFFQLESYQFPGYFRTLKRNPVHCLLPGPCSAVGCFLLSLILRALTASVNSPIVHLVFGAVALALSFWWGRLLRKRFIAAHAKKDFVITGRVKRLYVVLALVMIFIGIALSFISWLVTSLWPILLPLVIALAGLLAWPIEKLISECYFRDARRKLLSDPDLMRIGITGSYGKTSVKHILYTLLNEKYPTFKTPKSFNTPMGVTRAIREGLQPGHRIFLGEMGARHVGDIKEMCRLVRPTVGLITSVGPQHLETFKTIERIASTKYELIEALPQDGHAYFSDDGQIVRNLYQKTKKPKTLCGADATICDCFYENIVGNLDGIHFTLQLQDGERIDCRTVLLGTHNIQNIVLAAAVAHDLGLTAKQIQRGIAKLQPVENRLQLMKNSGGFTVINDAFNSNPVSSKAALETLRAFPKRRIIITPGMVELGKEEESYNREFGRQIADSVDIAIIIGKKRAIPILEGLKEKGFPEDCTYQVDTLDESSQLLQKIVRATDTVMYENDLPDHYQEA